MTGKQFKIAEILAIALTVFLMWEQGKFWGPIIMFVVMNVVLIYIYIKTSDALAKSNLKEKQEQWAVEYANNYIASLQQFDSLSPEQQKAVAEQERIPMIWVVNTEALCNIITEWLSSKDFMQNKYKQSIIRNLIEHYWEETFAIDEEGNLKKTIFRHDADGDSETVFDNQENVLYDTKEQEADEVYKTCIVPIVKQWITYNCTEASLNQDIFLKTIFLSRIFEDSLQNDDIDLSPILSYQTIYVRLNGLTIELSKQAETLLTQDYFNTESFECPSNDLVASGRKCFGRFKFTFVYQRKYDGEYYYDFDNETDIFAYIFADVIELIGRESGHIMIPISEIVVLQYDGKSNRDLHYLCTILLRNGGIYNISIKGEFYLMHMFYLIVNSLIGKHTQPTSVQENSVIENN